jgi:hypothetical protein
MQSRLVHLQKFLSIEMVPSAAALFSQLEIEEMSNELHGLTSQRAWICKDDVNISAMTWTLWNKAYEQESLREITAAIWMSRNLNKFGRNSKHLQNGRTTSCLNTNL